MINAYNTPKTLNATIAPKTFNVNNSPKTPNLYHLDLFIKLRCNLIQFYKHVRFPGA